MAEFVPLGMTAFTHIVDKHGEDIYEKVQRSNPLSSRYGKSGPLPSSEDDDKQSDSKADKDNNTTVDEGQRSSRRSEDRLPHYSRDRRHQAQLPSPERERDDYYAAAGASNLQSERYSQTSRARADDRYNYADKRRSHRDMSYGYDDRRNSSQGPPRSRHNDDDGSDYDEHSGRRYRTSGRGYDDRGDYDREIIETEVYKGPPRQWSDQRSPSYQDNSDYAVTKYGNKDVGGYDRDRRSRSRGRRERDRDYDDDRSYDKERERDREHEGIRGKLEDTFDTSGRGVGVGIAGAIVGGLAARQFGDKRHSKRDMVIGAVIGGLAVNAAENKYREWKEDRDEERYDDRYDGRSRSAMR